MGGDLPHYHPREWQTTTVMQAVSRNPYYLVVGGSYGYPIAAAYASETRARTFALQLERWRLFGGTLGGKHSVLVQLPNAIAYAVQMHRHRVGGVHVNVQTYCGGNGLTFQHPADITVPRQSLSSALKFVGEVFHVVPHSKACQLGRHNFPAGDVKLDVALMLQWGNMRQIDRERFLTPNELAAYRLWRNIPKHLRQPEQLTYAADAPHYNAIR